MVALRRALRRSRHLSMMLIVLTFLGTTSSWHAEDDDPDCAPQVAAHNHSAHDARLARASSQTAPTHCAICHWLQAFRADGARQTRVQASPVPQNFGSSAVRAAIRSGNRLDIPSRAPPSLI
jgi:hypothetical protein